VRAAGRPDHAPTRLNREPLWPDHDPLVQLCLKPSEPVQAHASTTGLIAPHQWPEILGRHFPPELPGPDHTTA
jgi:hypothetical protein